MAYQDASHYGPSCSMLRTPPQVSKYPNLPELAQDHSTLMNKTRRPLTETDSQDCRRILTEIFRHSDYKGKQKKIIEAAYAGADVLVVAPTGMGKSLCFQIPAIADKRGLSVIVSPLLALMQNQLDNLRSKHVQVAALHSQISVSERVQIIKQLRAYDTQIKLLYVTPEGLSSQESVHLLDEIYNNHNLNRLVIDEAHCISEWGHNFRSEYRKLGKFRDKYQDVPIMALTATATPVVQRDIIRSLKLDEDYLFTALHPFNRSNLFYEVRYLSNPEPPNQMREIFEYISTLHRRRGAPCSGIIYCRHRKTCDDLSGYLRRHGLNARPYHRGVRTEDLQRTLKSWTEGIVGEGGPVDVVVGTIALGLGIDKGDVRYILHYDLSKSFEGYYQETGRGGRDGHPAKCILYYSREDAIRVKRFIHSSGPNRQHEFEDEPTPTQRASGSLDALIQFAENVAICRHVAICRFFGEPIDENDKEIVQTYCDKMCDVCKHPERTTAKLAKLSSMETARGCVAASRATYDASSSRTTSPQKAGQLQNHASSTFRGQKRGVLEDGTSNKKLKAPYAPVLVTKPFESAASLSKPFRQPSMVARRIKETAIQPIQPVQIMSSNRTRSPQGEKPPTNGSMHLEAVVHEDECEISLPEVDISWEPETSGKASYTDRQKAFACLRSKFHKVLMTNESKADIWANIHNKPLDDQRKSEIIFRVAVELESSALLLSSTTNGYKGRIGSIRDDIVALSDSHLWDSDHPDFEDAQEIIQHLRHHSLPTGKGKHRAIQPSILSCQEPQLCEAICP